MKEYILNLKFKNWQNELWFINDNSRETLDKWENAIKIINVFAKSSNSYIEFQKKVIAHLEALGFKRVEK